MTIPATIISGDNERWSDDSCVFEGVRYESTGYALTYHLRGAGAPIDVTGSPDGQGWSFLLTTLQASALVAGKWWWSAVLTATGVQVTAKTGELNVTANFGAITATGYDGRSRAEIDLDAVNAAISARASGGAVTDYTIGNRSLKKEPLAALLVLRSALLIQIRNERSAHDIANGLGNPRSLFARFGSRS